MEYRFDETILEKAISKYGTVAQTFMLFEEMAELQKEVCKLKRGENHTRNCEEEMADVYIMLEQLIMMYGLNKDHIQDYMNEKIKRLDEKMETRCV